MRGMKNSTFAKRLAEAMEIRDLNQTDLHNLTKINKSSISTYLKGEYEAKQDKVDLLSRALHVSPAWLMGYDIAMDGSPKITVIDKAKKHFKKVPMLGYAAAGQPLEDINQDINFFDVENKYDVDFCITVRGDSMIDANINDGDIVFIKSMPEVPNGRIACVEIDNEKVCLKRFYKSGKTVSLVSANSKYAPMFFTEDNCENIKVLGLAMLRQSEIV